MVVEHARRFAGRWRTFLLIGDDGIEQGGSFEPGTDTPQPGLGKRRFVSFLSEAWG
jgi:hypothetical protein